MLAAKSNILTLKPKKPDPPAITQKSIPKLPQPTKPGAHKLYFDSESRGLAIRVTANDARSFVLTYRVRRTERRYTIGRCDEMTLVEARTEAEELRREIRDGRDPLDKRENDRQAPTMADLCADYFTHYADKFKREASLRNDHVMADSIIVPKLGKLRVSEVTHRDIGSLHDSLKKHPYRANRVMALLSKMFSLATLWHQDNPVWRADNPAKGVKKFHEEKRERWLDDDELARLAAALDKHPDQSACDAVRLILLTGSRKGEVLGAEWSQFDLAAGVWTKPSAHTTQKKTEHVPLSKEALAVLTRLKRESDSESRFVFPGRIAGKHLENVKSQWKELCKAAKLEHELGTRLHDLRHTFASHLVSHGVPLAVVGGLIGHTQPQTTMRYAHLSRPALQDGTDIFGTIFTKAEATAAKTERKKAKATARG
jgi:integrase